MAKKRSPLLWRWGVGQVHAAQYLLLKIHTDKETTGIANAPPYPYIYDETQVSTEQYLEATTTY